MALSTIVVLFAVFMAFAADRVLARRLARRAEIEDADAAPSELNVREPRRRTSSRCSRTVPPSNVRFELIAERGTSSLHLADHAAVWRSAMADIGARLRAEGVVAIVFAHGSFVGNDPLSALSLAERGLPAWRRGS
jgi:hypothetical protein